MATRRIGKEEERKRERRRIEQMKKGYDNRKGIEIKAPVIVLRYEMDINYTENFNISFVS